MWDDATMKKISGLLVNVANPALILSAGINQESSIRGMDLLRALGISLVLYAVFLVAAPFLSTLLKVDAFDRPVYKAMIVFSNIGFMGFPVIQAAYGNEALLYASVFLLPNNFLLYTYAIKLMSGNGNRKQTTSWLDVLKKIFNVGVLACILSFILYLSGVHVPYVLAQANTYIANMTAPLSMLVIGDSMTKINLKEVFCNVRLLIFSGIKLILLPVIIVFALKAFGLGGHMLEVSMIVLSAPVGTMNVIIAQQYDGNYTLASKGVAITTVLSVITMPLVAIITGV